MFSACAVHVDDHLREEFVAILDEAREKFGWSELRMCQEMLISQSQWHAQRRGDQHLSYTRLAMLPVGLKAWIGVLFIVRYGLPKEIATFLELAKIPYPKPEPVKMQPSELQERRRA